MGEDNHYAPHFNTVMRRVNGNTRYSWVCNTYWLLVTTDVFTIRSHRWKFIISNHNHTIQKEVVSFISKHF
jgi:hypothetical protein